MPLKTKENGFGKNCPEPPSPSDPDCPKCKPGQTEFCCRICWVDSCPVDWDLWIRDRNDGGGANWASYLNYGPVGSSKLELNGDMDKPSNNDFCADITSPCGLTPVSNGYAGEMACACLDGSQSFPKVFDIVTNLFGRDESCGSSIQNLCLQCFCDGAWMFTSTVEEVLDTDRIYCENDYYYNTYCGRGCEMGEAGNYGVSKIRHPAVYFQQPCCTRYDCYDTLHGCSICWSLSAKRADGTLYAMKGPGIAPSKFVIADDVDQESVVLYQDGIFVPRQAYQVLPQSVAEKAKVIFGQAGMRGEPCCGKKAKRRKPKSLF
jgi:hypothetical protein